MLLFAQALWLGLAQVSWARHPTKPDSADSSEDAPQSEFAGFDTAIQKKDYAAARQALARAYRHKPEPRIIYLLGTLALAEGHQVAAQDLMRRYLAEPGPDSAVAVKEALQIVEQRSGFTSEVNVIGEPNALIFLDGQLVGSLPLPLPLLLAAGEHTLTIELGRRKATAPIKILAGRGAEVRFSLDSDAAVVTQPPAVVILPEFVGRASTAGPLLVQVVERAVRTTNLAVFDTALAVGRVPALRRCLATADCQLKLGKQSEVDYVLTLRIELREQAENPALSFQLKLLDVRFGAVSAEAEKSCAGCSVEQAISELRAAAAALIAKGVGRPRGLLSISSQPAGATVRWRTTGGAGSQVLGSTPYSRQVWSGPMEVSVELSGHKIERLQALVPDGEAATYTVMLQPKSAGYVLGRPRWRFFTGAGLVTGSALLTGFGLSGLSFNAQCVDTPELPKVNCDNVYNTNQVGGALLGIGIAIGAAGVLMMALPTPSQAP